ncbi:putative G-protein coupled receptor 83 [Lamellibrachia satsuma]|nr:putative G-protein coupled receptor 83 [Lamellibrachia satsuma]
MSIIQELRRHLANNRNATVDESTQMLRAILEHGGNNVSMATDIINAPLRPPAELVVLVIAYSLVFAFSLVGNGMVCHVIYKNRRLWTVSNIFIVNLAASDIVITLVDVPFMIVRQMAAEWRLGQLPCQLINLFVVVPVYVSTFTMSAIALDRYMVILHPLRPRITRPAGGVVVAMTWLAAVMMSLPFAVFACARPVDMFWATVVRCTMCYPEPAATYERVATLMTFVTQYVIPISVAAFAYIRIITTVWSREVIGQATRRQQRSHEKTRRKTIMMLLLVVAVFSVCWLPLSLYHVLTDFYSDPDVFTYSSRAFLSCHWVAMSSVCFNPVIYFWLNESFRKEVVKRLAWLRGERAGSRTSPVPEVDGERAALDPDYCQRRKDVTLEGRHWCKRLIQQRSVSVQSTLGSLRLCGACMKAPMSSTGDLPSTVEIAAGKGKHGERLT